jgi:LacI family transcriptional regulator
MVTIKEVAARAGVSTATVSRHLGGQTVRAAVQIGRAVDQLGYTPSPVARSLKSGVSFAIGVVVPDVANPFFAAVVKGVESVTRQGSYNLLLCNTDESVVRQQQVLEFLAKRVDGILLAPVVEQDSADRLASLGLPVVCIDRQMGAEGQFDSVVVDNRGGARLAGEHLLGLGHRRLAMIHGPLTSTPGRERYESFLETAEAYGIELPARYIQDGGFQERGGYQAALRLFASSEAPTALFVANNVMTIGALKALHELGVRIPTDLSLICFDDLDLASVLSPPLTVVDRPTTEQGVLAMRLLLTRLDTSRPPAPPRTIRLDTRLLVRGSCAPTTGAQQKARTHHPISVGSS